MPVYADPQFGLGWQPWDMNRLKLEEWEAGDEWIREKIQKAQDT